MATQSIYEPVTFGLGLSPESTMGYGYSGKRYTLQKLSTFSWNRIHPELARRALALYFSHPGTTKSGEDSLGRPILHTPMGSGGGARNPVQQRAEFLRRHSTSPTGRGSRRFEGKTYYLKPGFAPYAPPGSSCHEDGTFEGYAMAIDSIGWQDGYQVKNAARFGLRHFANVNNEPWHIQPSEGWADGSKSTLVRAAALGSKLDLFPLPVFGTVRDEKGETCDCDALKPVPVKAGPTPPAPPPEWKPEARIYGLWPVNPDKPNLKKGDKGDAVKYLQWVINNEAGIETKADGDFGGRTDASVKAFQKLVGLKVDGLVGPATWRSIDVAATD